MIVSAQAKCKPEVSFEIHDRKCSLRDNELTPDTVNEVTVEPRRRNLAVNARPIKTEMTTRLEVGSDAPPVDVSVVIPCLNEANSISFCVEKAMKSFQAAGLRGEVVVGGQRFDGRFDRNRRKTWRARGSQSSSAATVLRSAPGICAARGAFIIMGDADDSYDFSEVPRFVEIWRQGYDVVMGNRFRGEIKPGAMPWHHKYIGNPVLTVHLNLFFHAGIGDSHCGMRGFTRAVYDRMDLRSTGMEFASEFVIKAAQLGARKLRKFPSRCGRTNAGGRRTCAASATAGGICASCCCTRRTGFFFCRADRSWLFGLFLVFWLLPGPPHFAARGSRRSHHDFRR